MNKTNDFLTTAKASLSPLPSTGIPLVEEKKAIPQTQEKLVHVLVGLSVTPLVLPGETGRMYSLSHDTKISAFVNFVSFFGSGEGKMASGGLTNL